MPDLLTKTTPDTVQAELNRYLAKVIINLVHPKLKLEDEIDPGIKKLYFFWQKLIIGDFAAFVCECFEKKYPWSYVRRMVELHIDCNLYLPCITYSELLSLYPCEVLSDNNELNILCDTVLKENPKSITDYKKGKGGALNHLKGQVMKYSKGKADINIVGTILIQKLSE